MEYQKIANLLDSSSNQPSKFRTKGWVEINDNQEEHTLLMDKSMLIHRCKGLVYVTTVAHI